MTKTEFDNHWNYYLSIEHDFAATSRYVEPRGQENVYSFEFAKLLILSCTEVESILKQLCYEKAGKTGGNIGEYKEIMLTHFPRIVTTKVFATRWGQVVHPFAGWDTGCLEWWNAYVAIKHNRADSFGEANYRNAVFALSALYILNLYLAKVYEIGFGATESIYIHSDYSAKLYACAPNQQLPDF